MALVYPVCCYLLHLSPSWRLPDVWATVPNILLAILARAGDDDDDKLVTAELEGTLWIMESRRPSGELNSQPFLTR